MAPSSRSSSLRAAVPIALIMRPPRADQDALLGLGLDPERARGRVIRSPRVLDLLDLDLDGVRDLLARAEQHLLADELGEQDVLAAGRRPPRAGSRTGPRAAARRGGRRAPRTPRAGARRDREDLGVEPERRRPRLQRRDACAWSTAVDLVDGDRRSGPSRRASAWAMKRSPGPPTPWSPLTTNSAASALARAPARRGAACARVSTSRGRCTPGQVDEHELPVVAASPRRGSRAASSAACRRRSRPCGRRSR